jgi:hypothetical protein
LSESGYPGLWDFQDVVVDLKLGFEDFVRIRISRIMGFSGCCCLFEIGI